MVHSFTDSDLSDTDNIVPFKNTTPINVINMLCVPFYYRAAWNADVV